MSELAYDVLIRAVVRVKAKSIEEGRNRIKTIIETTTPEELTSTEGEHGVWITAMSTWDEPRLFEVDGDACEPADPPIENLKATVSELIRERGPMTVLAVFVEEALRYRKRVRSVIADADGLVDAMRYVARKTLM
jgi:hypothetical protein